MPRVRVETAFLPAHITISPTPTTQVSRIASQLLHCPSNLLPNLSITVIGSLAQFPAAGTAHGGQQLQAGCPHGRHLLWWAKPALNVVPCDMGLSRLLLVLAELASSQA